MTYFRTGIVGYPFIYFSPFSCCYLCNICYSFHFIFPLFLSGTLQLSNLILISHKAPSLRTLNNHDNSRKIMMHSHHTTRTTIYFLMLNVYLYTTEKLHCNLSKNSELQNSQFSSFPIKLENWMIIKIWKLEFHMFHSSGFPDTSCCTATQAQRIVYYTEEETCDTDHYVENRFEVIG